MSFPREPKNRDYFTENKKLYRYNKKFNTWLLIDDVDAEINKVSDYSQHTKETDFLKKNFHDYDVVDHLVDVSELNIPISNKGVPQGDCAIFVYDIISTEPVYSYFNGKNNGVKIIDGNLQIKKASITKIRLFYMEKSPKGFGFYINMNKPEDYTEYLSIISQDGNSIDVYNDDFFHINNYSSVLKDGDNFAYIYSDDFKNIKAVINGEDKGIIEEFEFFFPVDFAYSNLDDFYITEKVFDNYPYILYEAKDVSLINYCDKKIEKSRENDPISITVEDFINLDEYSEDIEKGTEIRIVPINNENVFVRYTHKSGEIQNEVIHSLKPVSYIWDGNFWEAKCFDIGYIIFAPENPQFCFGGSWTAKTLRDFDITAWERIK